MYGGFERRLGRLLEPFPQLRAIAKGTYQRLNYYVRGQKTPRVVLHPLAALKDACDPGAGGGFEHDGRPHFFGYFGTCPWNRTGRYLLLHRLADDAARVVEVCLMDAESGALRKVAETRTWNFQQGSMAQWLDDGRSEHVCFNDVVDRQLVCRVLSLDGTERHAPLPVQAVRSGGREALSLNYLRLSHQRSEYGYDVSADNLRPDQGASEDGIWRMTLPAGPAQLLVSLHELIDRLSPEHRKAHGQHVNHAVYSPSGLHFVFMHRWLANDGRHSRLYCADASDGRLELLLDHRMVSHYAWKDDDTLLVWASTPEDGDRYYELHLSTGQRSVVGRDTLDQYGDGHPSFARHGEWLVTDSYPDRARMRHLLLYHPGEGRLVEVGSFFAPLRYEGAVRCDLHPRWSPDGSALSIDSAHEGIRRSYVLDVRRLLGR